MKETGVIMSGDHPKLILGGTKTMTRRTYGLEWINQDPDAFEFVRMEGDKAVFHKLRNCRLTDELPPLRSCPESEGVDPNVLLKVKCPYGQVGDWLWVKETWAQGLKQLHYKADWDLLKLRDNIRPLDVALRDDKWKSPRFMFKKFARIWRQITGLRAERLQEISEDDCYREGIRLPRGMDVSIETPTWMVIDALKPKFRELWDSLNAKRGYGWDMNKWNWVIGW